MPATNPSEAFSDPYWIATPGPKPTSNTWLSGRRSSSETVHLAAASFIRTMVDPTNRPRSPVGLRVCASIDRASPPLRGCADRRVANVSICDEEPILQHGGSAKMKSGEPIRASSKFVETLDEGIALLCRHKALPPFPHALHPSVSGYCNGRCEYDATSENYPSRVRRSQRVLLSRPTLHRPTPIRTTGLHFNVKLAPV